MKALIYHGSGKKELSTHHFRPDQLIEAYDTCGNAAKEVLKVILTSA